MQIVLLIFLSQILYTFSLINNNNCMEIYKDCRNKFCNNDFKKCCLLTGQKNCIFKNVDDDDGNNDTKHVEEKNLILLIVLNVYIFNEIYFLNEYDADTEIFNFMIKLLYILYIIDLLMYLLW